MTEKIRLNTITDNKYKHLSSDDREDIQKGLNQGLSFKEIGHYLHRDPGTISKEVKRNRICKKAVTFNDAPNNCQFAKTCRKQNVCGDKSCRKLCKQCDCSRHCPDFVPYQCKKLIRAPYVCNGCKDKNRCPADRYQYQAMTAHKRYQETLVSSRQGINASKDQIAMLDELLTPLIKKSQSVNHIYGTHKEALGISKSTFYTYCDLSLFSFRNIDLPRKVRYKKRKKKPKARVDQGYRVGRTYVDFKAYMEANIDTSVVEIDVVESVKGGRVFLTFYFRQTKLMLAFIMERQTQDCVTEVFDYLVIFLMNQDLTNQDITTLMINHINSIIRDSLNEKTPYDLAELLMSTTTLELLGLQRIKPDLVIRNPSIFKL